MQEEFIFTGALLDPRSSEEKKRDYTKEEVVGSSAPVEWIEKDRYNFYSVRNQSSSSSCGAQSGAKILGINLKNETGLFEEFSARAIYRERPHYPAGGMTLQNVLKNITSDNMAFFEKHLKSTDLNEIEMNSLPIDVDQAQKDSSVVYKAQGYVQINNISIDSIAEEIQAGRPVLMLIYFSKIKGKNEYWTYIPIMKVPDLKIHDDTTTSRHFVVAVDYTLVGGKKYLVVEDSAGNNTAKNGQRLLSENFVNNRCYGAGYTIDKKNEPMIKPVEKFSTSIFAKNLKYGMKNNKDVARLQKVLQYEKLLPTHVNGSPLPLGNYLGMTAKAVLEFQLRYSVDSDFTLLQLKGMVVGKKTIKVLNELYA